MRGHGLGGIGRFGAGAQAREDHADVKPGAQEVQRGPAVAPGPQHADDQKALRHMGNVAAQGRQPKHRHQGEVKDMSGDPDHGPYQQMPW